MTVENVNLVFLHEKIDPADCLIYNILLAFDHLGQIHFRLAFQVDAMFLKSMHCVVKVLRRIEQRFAWNAAYVQTGSSECGISLHKGCFHAELSASDCADISTRAGANYHDIILVHRFRIWREFRGENKIL